MDCVKAGNRMPDFSTRWCVSSLWPGRAFLMPARYQGALVHRVTGPVRRALFATVGRRADMAWIVSRIGGFSPSVVRENVEYA